MKKLLVLLMLLMATSVMAHDIDVPLVEGLPDDPGEIVDLDLNLGGKNIVPQQQEIKIGLDKLQKVVFLFGRTYVFGPGGGWQTKGQIVYTAGGDQKIACTEIQQDFAAQNFQLPNMLDGYSDSTALDLFNNGLIVNTRFYNGHSGWCTDGAWSYHVRTSMPETFYNDALGHFLEWDKFTLSEEGQDRYGTYKIFLKN